MVRSDLAGSRDLWRLYGLVSVALELVIPVNLVEFVLKFEMDEKFRAYRTDPRSLVHLGAELSGISGGYDQHSVQNPKRTVGKHHQLYMTKVLRIFKFEVRFNVTVRNHEARDTNWSNRSTLICQDSARSDRSGPDADPPWIFDPGNLKLTRSTTMGREQTQWLIRFLSQLTVLN